MHKITNFITENESEEIVKYAEFIAVELMRCRKNPEHAEVYAAKIKTWEKWAQEKNLDLMKIRELSTQILNNKNYNFMFASSPSSPGAANPHMTNSTQNRRGK